MLKKNTRLPSNVDLSTPFIVAGELERGFDSICRISINKGNGVFSTCTGTLIDPRWIVTAAHCLFGYGYEDVIVYFEHEGSIVKECLVEQIFIGDWDPQTKANDIALIYLKDPVSFTSPIKVLPPQLTRSLTQNTSLKVIGYGKERADGEVDNKKRSANVKIEVLLGSTIKCYYKPSGVCFGDSGGPALLSINNELFLAGITSYGDSKCSSFMIFTRVDRYYNFIKDIINTLTPTNQLRVSEPTLRNKRIGSITTNVSLKKADTDIVKWVLLGSGVLSIAVLISVASQRKERYDD